jgi:hypothetical protein
MSKHKELVKTLLDSLRNEADKWVFGECTAMHIDSNIELWTANIPVLDLQVYKPTNVSFSLLEKIKIYKAMSECRHAHILAAIKGAR